MSTLATEIEHELRALEPATAQQFERVVRDLLTLVKKQKPGAHGHPVGGDNSLSLADRLRDHPAIGTWPKNLDPDAHVAALREEW